jgi:CDP-diacylglycerol--glycerol-3-phosphate 3-phosphatidyltransferase
MENPRTNPLAASKAVPMSRVLWTIPNQLTVARLVLSVVCFVFLARDSYLVSLVLFVFAAATDWIDGYWARRYGQVTQLGRILDPFADKIIICGTFIFLAAVPPTNSGQSASEIAAWMAVVVVGREMLVTALRSFFEDQGVDFSAKQAGKWKMLFQCLAVSVCLWRLWYYDYKPNSWEVEPAAWSTWMLRLLVWVAVLMTIYSGWGYVRAALRMLKEDNK